MVRMMCPGISYSTVHSLIFHTNGSVQDNKLFQEFCNRKQATFDGWFVTADYMIDKETLTLIDQPWAEKYDYRFSAITGDYEVITTFMKINNISATWEVMPWHYDLSNSSYQLAVGALWCSEGLGFECCPPM